MLYVEHKSHIIISALLPSQTLIYDTAERLARSLRRESVTADVVRLMPKSLASESPSASPSESESASASLEPESKLESESEDEAYTLAVETLKLRIQAATAEALSEEEGNKGAELAKAFQTVFGAAADGSEDLLLWRFVAEWFWHDFVGVRLGKKGGDGDNGEGEKGKGEGEGEGQVWCID